MQRRRFLGTTVGIAGFGALGSTSVIAKGNPKGRGTNQRSNLVNAEQTDDGAIVATDDNFVISGQEITVDSQAFYDGDDGTYVIYTNGYSGDISDNEITLRNVPANPTFGVRVEGGDVSVRSNTITGDDALAHQFISVGFVDGATGTFEANSLHGGHRVGILADGDSTDVSIRDNRVIGLGPKSIGWAENGIQISRGATAHIRGNTIGNHWWDNNAFQSSGIILFEAGDSVHIHRNTIRDNDAGVVLWGGSNQNVIHNTVGVTEENPGSPGVFHTGIWVLDTMNSGVRQNTIDAVNGNIGIIVEETAENTKLIKNDISGFADPIIDAGADTKLPNPFDPDA